MRAVLRRAAITAGVVSVLALLTVSASAAQDALRVTSAFIRGLPPGQTTTAAFFTISNAGNVDARLIGAKTGAARSTEIHETRMHNGMMEMRQRASVTIAAHDKMTFASGGLHLMLIDLIRPLQDGELITMQLRFANRAPLAVPFKVRSVLNEPSNDAAISTSKHANHHE